MEHEFASISRVFNEHKNELQRIKRCAVLLRSCSIGKGNDYCTGSVRKASSHFEYLENRSRGLDVTWQPVRGDLTVHP